MSNVLKGRSTMIKWCLVFIAGIILWFIPESGIYDYEVKKFAVVTVVAVLMIAFEILPLIIPGIILMFGYYLTGVSSMAVSFSGWTQSATWLALGCLVMVAALQESGLLLRFSYWCMIKFGGNFRSIVIGIFVICIILSFITMGNAYVLMSAFALGCVLAMQIQDTKMAAVIGATVMIGTVTARSLFYSPMLTAVQVAQSQAILGSDYGLSATLIPLHNWPIIIAMVGTLFVLLKLYKPEKQINGDAYFREKYEAMGKLSPEEKRSVIFLIIIIGWMLLDAWIPLSSDYAIILIPWLMIFPGIGIAQSSKALERINWNIVFFVPSCFGIGAVASELGLGEAIADVIVPYIQDANSWTFLAIVYLIVFALNFLLTPYAIHACMTVPLLTIGLQLGINPECINYMLMHGSDAVLFPYEYTQYLIIFSFGFMKMIDFIKMMGISLIFKFVVVLGLLPIWWNIIGLI